MASKATQAIWRQHEVLLPKLTRGCHLVTDEISRQIDLHGVRVGLAHIFCCHTSASLCVNESYDPDVRSDTKNWLDDLAPETRDWEHADEGPDDMPAHAKTAITHTDITVPITNGRFNMGTWQGIWLLEHRDHASKRKLVITIRGTS